MCSMAYQHIGMVHDKLMKVLAAGEELPPSKQFEYLQANPELTALPSALPDGQRPINWMWTDHQDAALRGPLGNKEHASDPLFALAEAMCRGDAPGLCIPS